MKAETFIGILLVVGAIVVGILGWQAERWVNWKLSYGSKVDKSVEQLEARIVILESRIGVSTNSIH